MASRQQPVPQILRRIDRLLIVLLLMLAVPVVFRLVTEIWVWRLMLVALALVLIRVTLRLLLSRQNGKRGGSAGDQSRR